MSTKGDIWIAGATTVNFGLDAQQSILAFCLLVTRIVKQRPDTEITIGFSFNNYKGTPVIEGWYAVESKISIIAVLYGITKEEWNKYGPPKSIELSKEDMKKRGLLPQL